MLLSICIPTYSRAGMLLELLDSIKSQDIDPSTFEIVVSDDASTDNTLERLDAYAPNLANLRILKQSNNIGFDRNFLNVASGAMGDYIWFIGDDDRLEPGAICEVLKALKENSGIVGITLGSIDYDSQFKNPTGLKQLPATQILHSAEEVFSKIGDLLGFMSTLVIHRETWNLVCKESPVHNFFKLYVQVYIIGKALQRNPKWLILNQPCVGYRSDNDQFIKALGWYQRLAADVEAYHAIAEDLFGAKSSASRHFEAKIFNSHVRSRLVNGASAGTIEGGRTKAARLLLKNYYWLASFWLIALPILAIPKGGIAKARNFYQSSIPISGTQRAKRLQKSQDKKQ